METQDKEKELKAWVVYKDGVKNIELDLDTGKTRGAFLEFQMHTS